MTYDIRMNLPAEWQKEARNYVDEESGIEVTHVEAHLVNSSNVEEGMIDI